MMIVMIKNGGGDNDGDDDNYDDDTIMITVAVDIDQWINVLLHVDNDELVITIEITIKSPWTIMAIHNHI